MQTTTKNKNISFQDTVLENNISQKQFYLVIKRIADIIFSSAILFLTCPILIATAILIRLESKGSVFFLQERVGKDGKLFKVLKLRTMYTDMDKSAGGGVRTIENDPRITRIGKIIRRCSIDEFPQFINILKGDMSYIGPRPISLAEHNIVITELEKNQKPIPQGLIHRVKPGITGWALLHGREKISYEKRFTMNAEYENNISLWFDLKIFFLTFKKYAAINTAVFLIFAVLCMGLAINF